MHAAAAATIITIKRVAIVIVKNNQGRKNKGVRIITLA